MTAECTTERLPPLWLYGWVVLINTVVALLLWLFWPEPAQFGSILLSSQLVGFCITTAALLIGRLPWLTRLPDAAALGLNLLMAAPVGYYAGMSLSALIRGGQPKFFLSEVPGFGPWIATALATSLVGLLLWGRERIRAESMARVEAQRLAAEGELRLLRAQLEPHMLFNTLANLRELVAEDPMAARSMIDSLIAFLRQTLAATRVERTSLEAEFTLIRAYLSLMSMRMGDRLTWSTELPDELRGRTLPPMLLQPLVENAIQHGIASQVGSASIRVGAELSGGDLVVTVTDTGRGLDPTTSHGVGIVRPDSGRGYGLAHVRERLRAEYGPRGKLDLSPNEPRGTRARVWIPTPA